VPTPQEPASAEVPQSPIDVAALQKSFLEDYNPAKVRACSAVAGVPRFSATCSRRSTAVRVRRLLCWRSGAGAHRGG
jgi:hypothetical protein